MGSSVMRYGMMGVSTIVVPLGKKVLKKIIKKRTGKKASVEVLAEDQVSKDKIG